MNAVIDIGNTNAKYGLFINNQLVKLTKDKQEFITYIETQKGIKNIILSSVKASFDEYEDLLPTFNNIVKFSSQTPIPIQNLYKSPNSLGTDRLAGAIGANFLYPGEDCLVIDAGTCITYNFINSYGQYLGGAISPGKAMRYKALNTFTSRLPLIEEIPNPPLIGSDTEESIASGVVIATASEIKGMIEHYKRAHKGLKVLICGGDAKFFESKIKEPIFVTPELVLIGLNRILEHNVQIN